MGAYMYPVTVVFSCFSLVAFGFVSLEDIVRRFRKRRRIEKYIRSLEFRIYREEVTGGADLMSISELITYMGDEDPEYLEHRERIWCLLIFVADRCVLLFPSERKAAFHCADWLCDQLLERYAEYAHRRMLIDAVLDTIETLFGLAWKLDHGIRIRISDLRNAFEKCD